MFSYYGSKIKIAKYYPKPLYDIIIEPFAGSASYSSLYSDRSIVLNEKDDVIYSIWNWLIHEATKEDILNNRDFYFNQDISNIALNKNHKNLIGFCINRGSVSPCNIVQAWSCQDNTITDWASTVYSRLTKIASKIDDIKKWNVTYGDYSNIPNIECTWFIDPPYKKGGNRYIHNSIDYVALSKWCKSRKGQVIVCENNDADWLDFKPLINIQGQFKKNTEVYWTNV